MHESLMLTTRPEDADFWEKVKILNGIHPIAVPSYWRETTHVRCGEGLQNTRPSLVTLKRVVFKSGGEPKMFANIKRRPRYPEDSGPEMIECDGHRLEIERIERIEVELAPYDHLSPWSAENTHNAGHNEMTAAYAPDGTFLGWECTCGYRYQEGA